MRESENNLMVGINNGWGNSVGNNGDNNVIFGSNNKTQFIGNANNNLIGGQNNTFLNQSGQQPVNNVLGGINSWISGRNNIVWGGTNRIYSNSTGRCAAFGSQQTIGTSSLTNSRAFSVGFFNKLYKNESTIIGRYCQALAATTANGGDTTTTSTNIIILGQYNDYQNNNYTYGRNIPTIFAVGAGSGGGNNARKNALLITRKGTVNNIPNVGNVSNVESCIIMPEVGEHHNYASDCIAAQNGIPLYGLYRNGNDLKIRVNECGSGNPPTTTTTTSKSGGGTSGPRILVTRCSDSQTYYLDASIYCDDGNATIIPGGAFSSNDVVLFQITTDCSGATYCGTLGATSTGAFTGRIADSGTASACTDLFCYE